MSTENLDIYSSSGTSPYREETSQSERRREILTATRGCLSRTSVVRFRKVIKFTVYSLITFSIIMLLSLESRWKILNLLHDNDNTTAAQNIIQNLTEMAKQTLSRKTEMIQ